jgi:hypothetical protein
MVPTEAIVLSGQEGLNQLGRQLVVADRDAALFADRLDQLAVPGIDAQRHLELDLAKAAHIGQRGPQVDISTDVSERD